MTFGVIAADPPWSYQNFTDKAHGSVKPHYDTLSIQELVAIQPVRWASPDCVLALWATWPKLDEAVDLMRAWCFNYVTGIPWVKTTPSTGEINRGVGFWSMSASEMLLIGRRGEPRLRDRKNTPLGLITEDDRVFYAPRTKRHSEKPEDVQSWLERKIDGPYLELFARRTRPGWTCWGLETGWRLSERGCEAVEEAVK